MALVRSNRRSSDFTVPVICAAGSAVGDVVYVSGPSEVAKADSSSADKMPAAGALLSVVGLSGVLATAGVVTGAYSGLVPGHAYYVGLDGRPVLLSVIQLAGHAFCQRVGVALDSGTLLLSVSGRVVRL